jgi:GxxExxY protein
VAVSIPHKEDLRPEIPQELNAVTEEVIRCAFEVSNTLGRGFLEKVYENALAHELHKSGHTVLQQHSITVTYAGVVVGDYVADLLVDDLVLVELKVARKLDEIHLAQCLNYLKATGKRICLLLNFHGAKVQVKRIAN